jgi:hypothetical protein
MMVRIRSLQTFEPSSQAAASSARMAGTSLE